MKKIMSILMLVILMSGCDQVIDTIISGGDELLQARTEANANKQSLNNVNEKSIGKWIDKETGCEYLVFKEHFGNGMAGGITPRMKKEGDKIVQICSEPPE